MTEEEGLGLPRTGSRSEGGLLHRMERPSLRVHRVGACVFDLKRKSRRLHRLQVRIGTIDMGWAEKP